MDHAERARKWWLGRHFVSVPRHWQDDAAIAALTAQFTEVAAGAEQRVMACHDCREYREMVAAKLRQAECERAEAQATLDALLSEEPCQKCGMGVSSECYGCKLKQAEAEVERLRRGGPCCVRTYDRAIAAEAALAAEREARQKDLACHDCREYREHKSAELRAEKESGKRLSGALRWLVEIIDKAGLHNLSNGVQLGPIVWYVKANDALENAKAALRDTAEGGEPE